MRDAPHRALWQPHLRFVLDKGPLGRRMLQCAGVRPRREDLVRLCAKLRDCLERDRLLAAGSA